MGLERRCSATGTASVVWTWGAPGLGQGPVGAGRRSPCAQRSRPGSGSPGLPRGRVRLRGLWVSGHCTCPARSPGPAWEFLPRSLGLTLLPVRWRWPTGVLSWGLAWPEVPWSLPDLHPLTSCLAELPSPGSLRTEPRGARGSCCSPSPHRALGAAQAGRGPRGRARGSPALGRRSGRVSSDDPGSRSCVPWESGGKTRSSKPWRKCQPSRRRRRGQSGCPSLARNSWGGRKSWAERSVGTGGGHGGLRGRMAEGPPERPPGCPRELRGAGAGLGGRAARSLRAAGLLPAAAAPRHPRDPRLGTRLCPVVGAGARGGGHLCQPPLTATLGSLCSRPPEQPAEPPHQQGDPDPVPHRQEDPGVASQRGPLPPGPAFLADPAALPVQVRGPEAVGSWGTGRPGTRLAPPAGAWSPVRWRGKGLVFLFSGLGSGQVTTRPHRQQADRWQRVAVATIRQRLGVSVAGALGDLGAQFAGDTRTIEGRAAAHAPPTVLVLGWRQQEPGWPCRGPSPEAGGRGAAPSWQRQKGQHPQRVDGDPSPVFQPRSGAASWGGGEGSACGRSVQGGLPAGHRPLARGQGPGHRAEQGDAQGRAAPPLLTAPEALLPHRQAAAAGPAACASGGNSWKYTLN